MQLSSYTMDELQNGGGFGLDDGDSMTSFPLPLRTAIEIVEEGTWAAWLYDLLKPHVDKLVVCDPRRNAVRLDSVGLA
jgi:hypothetical protein